MNLFDSFLSFNKFKIFGRYILYIGFNLFP